jgi:hypothetical protein
MFLEMSLLVSGYYQQVCLCTFNISNKTCQEYCDDDYKTCQEYCDDDYNTCQEYCDDDYNTCQEYCNAFNQIVFVDC